MNENTTEDQVEEQMPESPQQNITYNTTDERIITIHMVVAT